jgi:hypothetical protein
MAASTAAMRVSLKAESAAAKSTPQQHRYCGRYNRQRNQLLPIHGRKITPKSPGATNHLNL